MIKEAIEKIQNLVTAAAEIKIIEVDDRKYSDKPNTELIRCPRAPKMHLHTLGAVRDYFNCLPDAESPTPPKGIPIFITVDDFNSVLIISALDENSDRQGLVECLNDSLNFPFGQPLDTETFVVKLQSCFVPSDALRAVLQLVGNITEVASASYSDDGVTQTVNAKTTVIKIETVPVPNPVKLAPFRTFTEIEQPESNFVLRIAKGGDKGPTCTLHEADGGRWKVEAINSIRDWLRAEINDKTVTILA